VNNLLHISHALEIKETSDIGNLTLGTQNGLAIQFCVMTQWLSLFLQRFKEIKNISLYLDFPTSSPILTFRLQVQLSVPSLSVHYLLPLCVVMNLSFSRPSWKCSCLLGLPDPSLEGRWLI